MRELVIDSFAGGGGASEGIKMALDRDPDIAVNHDAAALAMHRVNHPNTRHLIQDVAVVDSVGLCAGQPVGMLWMSPDCTDHSKAKGAAPNRDGINTRGIGWAIVGWVKALAPWQRPRVVFLENVEEYVDWGPMLDGRKRCPRRKGETFRAFVDAWRALGYHNIEWRLRRAWKDGAGTIRNRLYMVMRRDDEPIVWPEPTHGNPNDPADAVRIAAGELKPWVPVADCLDFNLPCPSIFETVAEIKLKHGVRAKRPLAPKTMARVAKGVRRYVLDAARPFVVKVNHTARDEARDRDAGLPLSAVTLKRDDAVVTPYVVRCDQNSGDPTRNGVHSPEDPARTIHTAGSLAVVAPVIAYAQHGGAVRSPDVPVHTITASPKDQNSLIMPVLVGCGGRAGQSPPRPGSAPAPTATAKADACVVAPYLVPRYGERAGQEPRTYPGDRPGPTPVPTGNEGSLAAVAMAAFIAQHNDGPRPGAPGHDAGEPAPTITTAGAQQAVVAASMLTLRGSDGRDSAAGEPGRTDSAKGQHNALVSLPLMTVYYGTDDDGAPVDQPSRTETAKPRFGLVEALAGVPPFTSEHEARARAVAEFLRSHGCWDGDEFVTIEIDGVTFVLVDIGMRMLTPRERFSANGFPRDYIIDHGIDEHGNRVEFTLEQQGYMCGNAVCPPVAAALVRANYRPREVEAPRHWQSVEPMPLFQEAAE